ncbi:MAG: hypothetical protein AB1643_01640 [Patescibacteria group bacterium]
MTTPKKIISHLIVLIWIIFSLIYIVYDVWSDFKSKQLNQAYQQGKIDTINTLIKEAEQCNPLPVFSDEKQIQLINVSCLQAPATE